MKYKTLILTYIILLCLILSSCTTAKNDDESSVTNYKPVVNTTSEKDIDTWIVAYERKLYDYYLDYNKSYRIPQPIYYSVCDLYINGVPELIIREGYNEISKCTLFTYEESKVTELFSFYDCDIINYYPDSHTISVSSIEKNYNYYAIYHVNYDGIKRIFDLSYTTHEDKSTTYEINGARVTKEEYHDFLDENSSKIPGLYDNKVELSRGSEYHEWTFDYYYGCVSINDILIYTIV